MKIIGVVGSRRKEGNTEVLVKIISKKTKCNIEKENWISWENIGK